MMSEQFTNTAERIDFAEQVSRDAGLSFEQVAGMQAYLLGAALTHFDQTPIVPMTSARWSQLVRAAHRCATRNGETE